MGVNNGLSFSLNDNSGACNTHRGNAYNVAALNAFSLLFCSPGKISIKYKAFCLWQWFSG